MIGNFDCFNNITDLTRAINNINYHHVIRIFFLSKRHPHVCFFVLYYRSTQKYTMNPARPLLLYSSEICLRSNRRPRVRMRSYACRVYMYTDDAMDSVIIRTFTRYTGTRARRTGKKISVCTHFFARRHGEAVVFELFRRTSSDVWGRKSEKDITSLRQSPVPGIRIENTRGLDGRFPVSGVTSTTSVYIKHFTCRAYDG